jgi:hypothetical protein
MAVRHNPRRYNLVIYFSLEFLRLVPGLGDHKSLPRA